ncbi:methyl-accepting chemotaxis protein [Actinoplanes lutulentus]|uniref:Methyl-accepting chemotaxis protein n=1 Tax=Actinoplanes lutulentus TaxID=1287878 RepID=A0A327ZJC2_9ACTN|nr:methyl-accepting chemotaxis protein [Actinoplanes lutulentus]MBB2944247.1 methyl-accepting chemotaxis protein [Actinoplanes lutulentus]RAK42520.1 methyl-accepting chemotaxis protein [Actinoplanes lutulentus]
MSPTWPDRVRGSGATTSAQRIDELTAALADRDAELDRLRADRDEAAQIAQVEQVRLNQRLRRRAKEAIDSTADVIGGKLEDVVVQVGAARDAAAATQERVTITNDAAEALVQRARSADEAATALNASLRQVAGIASVISRIASQTRLLALNATIEAVRAGSAGSGFAVVADEVKGLANTTADSTEQITSTIAALEADVAQMGETLSAIIRDVGEIEDAMRQLGGIADRQSDIVMLLHQSVDATMAQIGDLSDVAERLERRRHDRLPVRGRVSITTPAQTVDAEIVDLSADGLGCMVARGVSLTVGDGVRAELTVDGFRATVEAKVARRLQRDDGSLEIGLEFLEIPAGVEDFVAKLGADGP